MGKEIFVGLPTLEKVYLVGNKGTVKGEDRYRTGSRNAGLRFYRGKKLTPFISKNGYVRVGIVRNGIQRLELVHRLVAICFIPNPENKPQINHKDGNKLNNSVENLEWATRSENQLHAHRIGLKKSGADHHNSKKVLNKVSGEVYGSISIAAKKTGIDMKVISWRLHNSKNSIFQFV